MNEEQKAQALALLAIPDVQKMVDRRNRGDCIGAALCAWWYEGATAARIVVPNLADESGVVEGWLHRVLEKLVGEPVEVRESRGPIWSARKVSAHTALPGSNWTAGHPTRLDAIVAALLALEVKP